MVDNVTSVNTPTFIVNEAVALRNITAFQSHCNEVGLALRPHIKTHKSIHFAKAQMAAGAIGITCQKISEAEAMINSGINDILITFNIIALKNWAACVPYQAVLPLYRSLRTMQK